MSSERFDHYEVLRETGALIDSLTESERRQVMASLAERYGFHIADKAAVKGRSYSPVPRSKRTYS